MANSSIQSGLSYLQLRDMVTDLHTLRHRDAQTIHTLLAYQSRLSHAVVRLTKRSIRINQQLGRLLIDDAAEALVTLPVNGGVTADLAHDPLATLKWLVFTFDRVIAELIKLTQEAPLAVDTVTIPERPPSPVSLEDLLHDITISEDGMASATAYPGPAVHTDSSVQLGTEVDSNGSTVSL
jgi:hypothetical protein